MRSRDRNQPSFISTLHLMHGMVNKLGKLGIKNRKQEYKEREDPNT